MVSGVSAAESGATNNVQTATNEPGGSHQVRAGETLSQIAQRYGTDVGTLAALNDIRTPALIHVGAQLPLLRAHLAHIEGATAELLED